MPGTHEGSAASAPAWARWLIPAVVAAANVVAFSPVLSNGFVRWDDYHNLVDNPHYRGLGPKQLIWMFTTFHRGHYQPLTWVSFGLDYLLWGEDARGFHLTNLILHAANAVLLYLLALRLLRLAMPARARDSDGAVCIAAGLAAAVFALHPLRVESVAWATERRDVLSGFFYLLTLLAYLHAQAAAAQRAVLWRRLSVVSLLLALLAKVMSVSLPVVLVVLDVYPLRRLRRGAWLSEQARPVWAEKWPFFLLALIFCCIAPLAQLESNAMHSLASYGVGARLTQVAYSLVFYLRKTVWPTGLSPLYALPEQVRVWEPRFLISAVAACAITAALLWARRRWPAGLAVWICYGAILAPVSGIAQNGPQITADRYSYLSCMSLAVLAAGGLIACRRFAFGRGGGKALFGALVATGVMGTACLATLTWRQAAVWHDSVSLWRRVLAATGETHIAHTNLGVALVDRGDVEEAIAEQRKAHELRPDDAPTCHRLAFALSLAGRLDEAAFWYERALAIDPEYVDALINLAATLRERGRLSEAKERLERAVRIAPHNAVIHTNLAILLDRMGEGGEAEHHYRLALAAVPDDADAAFNLGELLNRQGRFAEAIAVWRAGLAANPGAVDMTINLAIALATCPEPGLRDGREALRLASRACEATKGRNPRALFAKSAALAEVGRLGEAVAVMERAVFVARSLGETELAAHLASVLEKYRARQASPPRR